MAQFGSGEQNWIERLGNLRDTIRQEVIARQIADHLGDGSTVLDVGCGQGTQGLRLMERGCTFTGVEPSAKLRQLFRADASASGFEPELIDGTIDDLDDALPDRVFDLVCAHGLLMYLDDVPAAVASLARRVAPGGCLSITCKNAHGLAMRPALRGQWEQAIAAFEDHSYRNELGVEAQAHTLHDMTSWIEAAGLEVVDWYGVRVFNDAIAGDVMPPTDGSLEVLLDAEDRSCRIDPYRWLGSQLHLIARRAPTAQTTAG